MPKNIPETLKKFGPLILIILLTAVINNRYFFSGTSNQGYPRSFLAQDTYWDLWRINQIEDTGSINIQAKVLTAFHPEKFVTADGPILHYAVFWFGELLGVENYVSVHVLLVFAYIAIISILYVLIHRVSQTWAWLSLPFMLACFQFPFVSTITWGFWRSFFAMFIFFTLLIFYPFRFGWRHVILFSFLLGTFLIAHPFIAPYIIMLLAFSIFSKHKLKEGIIKFVSIGIGSAVLFFDYLMNFIAYRHGRPKGDILSNLGFFKYTLYGADAKFSTLGIWWWVALLGFMASTIILMQKKKMDIYKKQLIVIMSIVFLIYPLQEIIPRLMQFRLSWPLILGVFIGFLLFQVFSLIRVPKDLSGLAGFFCLLIILSLSFFSFPKMNTSIISRDLYGVFNYVKQNTNSDSTVLLIDPTLTQGVATLGTYRHTRYIPAGEFTKLPELNYNLSNITTNRACQFSKSLRKPTNLKKSGLGYGFIPQNLSDNLCKKKQVRLCENDYLILNFQYYDQRQVDIMKNIVENLENSSFTEVLSRGNALLLKNNDPCGTWMPEYIT